MRSPAASQIGCGLISDTAFELEGRVDDVVNIGGKRASLEGLNRLLLSIDGVIDGVIFDPPAATDVLARAALDGARRRARYHSVPNCSLHCAYRSTRHFCRVRYCCVDALATQRAGQAAKSRTAGARREKCCMPQQRRVNRRRAAPLHGETGFALSNLWSVSSL